MSPKQKVLYEAWNIAMYVLRQQSCCSVITVMQSYRQLKAILPCNEIQIC